MKSRESLRSLSCFAPLQFGDPCVEVEPLLNGETLALLFFRVESIIIDVIKDQKREIQFQFQFFSPPLLSDLILHIDSCWKNSSWFLFWLNFEAVSDNLSTLFRLRRRLNRVNGFESRKWGVLCNFLSLLDNRPIKSLINCLSAKWQNYSSLDLYKDLAFGSK